MVDVRYYSHMDTPRRWRMLDPWGKTDIDQDPEWRYPATYFAFDSALGAVNSASSGRLIAAWRVGVVICAPVRSVT